ncbi:MAG: MFS transporter [Verrucomicrobia bacterium]|nr:MFS transporter [Verrucomicrobiota bacterium]
MPFKQLEFLTAKQWNTIIATYLGWTLDAFDFFLLVLVVPDIAHEFLPGVANGRTTVGIAVNLTLAMRPVGALLFGLMADRLGRRPTLIVNILCYSVLAFASGFAPSLTVLIILRALFGIAMGGEWGVGASLAMETIPLQTRGIVSGILQAGYPSGYLLASLVYALLGAHVGWRILFMLGAVPALLILFIRRNVDESPAWLGKRPRAQEILRVIQTRFPLFIFAILLMTAFNFFSHGTQDVYPTFLRVQRQFPPATVGTIGVIFNIGAILGGLTFGMFSQRIGRRRTIVIAALLAILVIPLWAFSHTAVALAIGAFIMQFFVQGAWGVVPAHLNELSPPEVRGTFPGFTYQLGNLLASVNYTLQSGLADRFHGDYGLALAIVVAIVAAVLALLAGFGPEAKDTAFVEKTAAGRAA